MAKKKAEAKPEAKTEPAAPTNSDAQGLGASPTVIGPRFNPHVRPVATESSTANVTSIRQSYESIQENAKGPGVEEWRRTDKLRADLTELYRSLSEDDRYAPEYKAQRAWEKYEETRAQVEKLAPEARQKMLKSADGLVQLQERFWVMRCSAAYALAERRREVFVNTHKATLPIAQKVS